MEDKHQKPELPIHIILVVGECSKIKTNAMIKVREQSQPIAEKTHLGWTITFAGKEGDVTQYVTMTNYVDSTVFV